MQTKNRDNLVKDNLRLVSSLCSRFTGRGIDYEDLFSSGCLGLVKAAKGFDESRGLMFSTYAVPVILGEIKRLFRDGGEVKVSRSIKELYLKATRVKEKLEKELLREVTVKEIAEEMSLPLEALTEAFCACRSTVSLTVTDEDGEREFDIADKTGEEELTERITLNMAISKLDDKEQKIIKFRYFGALTQSETAKKLSMSQVQVSRAEKVALVKLKRMLEPGA
ncbi:MAG: sigma-70 family RNA polymerase sigma factor [Clostridia bacterium]|nr:sigma-70 family RNA polymerase sigma factor [Clostridia bacterium]